MKTHMFVTLSLLVSACQSFAQNPPYSPIEIKINSDAIQWVQSVPRSLKANSASAGDTLDNLNKQTHRQLDFSSVPKGFLGIGLNTARNTYGFISEEIAVTLKPGAANTLKDISSSCKLIVESAQLYVCKASSVPQLQTLLGQLSALPNVKSANAQFVTQFNHPN